MSPPSEHQEHLPAKPFHQHPASFQEGLSKSRIETLSDGVFSIVMTLLILNIKIPVIPEKESFSELIDALIPLWPSFLGHFLSFLIVGAYWINTHNIFHYIRHTDRLFLWLNIIFLSGVSIIPFTAALLETYPLNPTAICAYAIHQALTASVMVCFWHHASTYCRLIDPHTHPEVIRRISRKILVGFFINLLIAMIACFFPVISLILLVLVLLFYIFPFAEFREVQQQTKC